MRHLFQNKHPKLKSTVTILSEDDNQVFFLPAENFNFGVGSGYVKMTSEDGNYFQGYLRQWVPNKGIMISNRGEVGAGGYVQVEDLTPTPKVCFDGFCLIKCANGDKFEGEMKQGRRQGKGRIVWSEGGQFKGNFIDDEIQGEGEITFANGECYKGNFVDGMKSGEGKNVYCKSLNLTHL